MRGGGDVLLGQVQGSQSVGTYRNQVSDDPCNVRVWGDEVVEDISLYSRQLLVDRVS